MKNRLIFLGLLWVFASPLPGGYAWCLPMHGVFPGPHIAMVPSDTTDAIYYTDFQNGYPGPWLGDTASFETANGLLGLVAPARSPVSIAIPSSQVRNRVWEAGVVASGAFSASNYIRLYLVASTPLLGDPQWGYYLQIDREGANHVYRLWRQNGSTRTSIFESRPMPVAGDAFRARVRVTCTMDGDWQVAVDEHGNRPFETLMDRSGGTWANDETYHSGPYSGYLVRFSPARWRDFKLDYMLIKRLDSSEAGGSAIGEGDILINEVLANPKTGGVDFLEIYNYSDKTIDLSGVSIARVTTGGIVGNPQMISDHPLFIRPHEYKVLTRQPAVLMQHYPSGIVATFIQMATLPDFNNETGGVVVYGSQKVVVDSLFYTPAMQSPFMVSNRGVSLERRHFSVPTNTIGNFHSAAIAAGGATPGYPNSQYVDEPSEGPVFLTSKTFSPDNDGFEDRLEINYSLPEGGFMVNIDIYTDQGRLVKRLVRNQSLAMRGTVYWDGLSDADTRPAIGMYVAVIEVYNAKGVRKIYRNSFVLAARL